MTRRLAPPCGVPLCPNIAVSAGRCEQHKPRPWARPNGVKRAGGRTWQRTRARIFDRDGHACRYCGAPAEVVDHVVNRARGGSDDDQNLVAACRQCNQLKLQQEKKGNVTMTPMPTAECSEEITF